LNSRGIFILPLGAVPGEVIKRLMEGLGRAFGRDVTVMGVEPLPAHGEEPFYERKRGQWHSTRMLGAIPAPGQGGMVLGVAEVDLYAPGLNFVFGEADTGRGVCLISLARLREEFWGRVSNEDIFLERALKEAVHELGHLHGLRHCPDRGCVMHFSNSLPDTDVKGRAFCGRCRGLIRSD
jgi:archaemetzincin